MQAELKPFIQKSDPHSSQPENDDYYGVVNAMTLAAQCGWSGPQASSRQLRFPLGDHLVYEAELLALLWPLEVVPLQGGLCQAKLAILSG